MKRDVLKEIAAKKKEKIILAKQQLPEQDLISKVQGLSPTTPFLEAINKARSISLIAEIKKKSPSRGIIRENFNPQEIAKIYAEAGVQAISVLTEEDFFDGNLSYLHEVKGMTGLPVLRKDFILDTYQIYESRYFGADAVLLITDLLTKDELTQFIQLADTLDMDCLVEVHTEKELKKILNLKIPATRKETDLVPPIKKKGADDKKFIDFAIGLNNRDLHTLEVDIKTTEKLYILVPKDRTVVVESGLKTSQDVLFLKILGVNAVLIGEAFMEAPDIARKVQEVMGW